MHLKRWSVVIVVVAGFGSLVGPPGTGWFRTSAVAADSEAAALQANATTGGRQDRLKAIDDLRELGDSDSRAALAELANSKDEQLATFAMSAIARSDDGGAKAKLEAIVEDASRSTTARAFALTHWCALRKRQGAEWEDVQQYVASNTASNAALADAAAAVKAARFEEVR